VIHIGFDVETTGFSPAYDRIVEIGAVRFCMRSGQHLAQFQQFVNPGMPIPEQASAIHGITDDMVAGAPYISRALGNLLSWINEENPQGAPVHFVAHNARFDRSFFEAAIEECGFTFPVSWIDTLPPSRRVRYGGGSARIADIASFLGIAHNEQHRALGDAWTAARLHLHFSGVKAYSPVPALEVESSFSPDSPLFGI
jgi:DNA polymerase III epsilon subunit-like protein